MKTGQERSWNFLLFFNSFVQCILGQDIWSWPCLNTLYMMQDKLDQLLHKYQQILSRYFPPSSKSQHLHWTQTHNHLHVPQLCKTSLRLPALPYQSRGIHITPWELLWGNKFFSPSLFDSEGNWDFTVIMGWHKKSFLVWGLQLPLVSWVFLGSWWEALGMWQRREQGKDTHDQTDRQTDTLHCVYINVSFPKYQAFSYKWANIPL